MLPNIKNEAPKIHDVEVLANYIPLCSSGHKKRSQSQATQNLKRLFLSTQSGVVLSEIAFEPNIIKGTDQTASLTMGLKRRAAVFCNRIPRSSNAVQSRK